MMEPIHFEALFPDRLSSEPLGRQLVRRIRAAIESGVFKPSMRLLPSRELAARLGLARNTVTDAIDQLVAEGYLETRIGSGTFVAPLAVMPRRTAAPNVCEYGTRARSALALKAPVELFRDQGGALECGHPDPNAFPVAIWQRLMRASLSSFAKYATYGEPFGLAALREAVALHTRQFRGIATDPRRTIIVEGTQAALALIAEVLAMPGDAVVVEDPCYPLARDLFRLRLLRVTPVDVDDDGLQSERAPGAALAYVTPSHQFPLGSIMSLARRTALLAWAVKHDAYVIEDDYDSEYYFGTRPLPALQTLDGNERVIYVGSFSKTLFPSLRIAYVIVPEHLVEPFTVARTLLSMGGTSFVHATLAAFIDEGHFARHVRRALLQYELRRDALLEALNDTGLSETFAVGRADSGLHLTIRASGRCDDIAIAASMPVDTRVQPLSSYSVARSDCSGFVIGYSAQPAGEIRNAVGELARAVTRFGALAS